MTEQSDAERVEAMLKGLSELPPVRAISYRGCDQNAQFVREGQSVATQYLTPTSGSPAVALGENPAPLYAILGNTGRHVAPFSARREENEVVFLPGSLFYLQSTQVVGDVVVHLVLELDPAAPAKLSDQLIPQLFSKVDGALTSMTPMPPPPPKAGKYSGDIA